MKIVHIVPSFARGGGERLVIELANRQAASGHEVDIVLGHRLADGMTHAPPSKAVRLHFIGKRPLGRLKRYQAGLGWIRERREWLASRDVVHCHLTYGGVITSALQLTMRRGQRPAFVETYHAVGMPIPKSHRWLHGGMISMRDAVAFMVEDPWWARFLERQPDLIGAVIPVGVEAPGVARISRKERQSYRAELGIPPDAQVVGTIGRLHAARQPHRYASIFAEIARQCGPDVHFVIGGDGSERARVEQAVRNHGLTGRVHLIGEVRNVARALSIMDLYVTANVGSVCGVAGLQAIASGLPTVAVQLMDGYAQGEDDWIWSSSDERKVGGKAASLLHSPAKAQALAAAQSRYLDAHHSPAAMAAAYERFYDDAIAAVRRKR